MQLLNPLRRWFWRFKLGLIRAEIQDTLDDMRHALHEHEFGTYRALADFHSQLVAESLRLQANLNSTTN